MLTVPRAAFQAKNEGQDLSSRAASPFEGFLSTSLQQHEQEPWQDGCGAEADDNWNTQPVSGKLAAVLPLSQDRRKTASHANETLLCILGKAKQRSGDEELSRVMQGSAAKANSTMAFPFCRPAHCWEWIQQDLSLLVQKWHLT